MSFVVETATGRVEGFENAGRIEFRGIPYAAPPLGALRWQPPQVPEPWSGVRACREFGPNAPQPPRPPGSPLGALANENTVEDEDCLYLNVFTPALDGSRRPVLFWIHGGAFRTGSGSNAIYSQHTLLQRADVVVVTINYRLGPLGFLNLEAAT